MEATAAPHFAQPLFFPILARALPPATPPQTQSTHQEAPQPKESKKGRAQISREPSKSIWLSIDYSLLFSPLSPLAFSPSSVSSSSVFGFFATSIAERSCVTGFSSSDASSASERSG